MILNQITGEQIKVEIQNVLTNKGAPVLYLKNHGIPNYEWRRERIQKVLASCFDDDE